ncbi:hypothetical protein NLI96_g9976 [Meripilus lineatus]|uniref:DUF962-domain-containing protein n=1 Tax=Meripilus lineatus TaxID=2056292 RepID=A0AAD5UUS4_9APHY|nr:hypothetical protein NLI96_g9976 [Physisporinus lineatus]
MSSLFGVRKQLTFYGAYHSHPVNILIHITCVPLILWTAYVVGSYFPTPSFFPAVHHEINPYLVFDFKWPTVFAAIFISYYYTLEPFAAPNSWKYAAVIHVVCWIFQFIGHGVFEKRAPALLDNLIGALILAPFFVHIELLFHLGYNPQLRKDLRNDIGVEITRIRKIEGDKKRANANAKKQS